MKRKTPLEIEQQLLESDDQYKRLVENSPDIITVHDGKRLLFINPAGAFTLGANHPDEIIGREITDFIHPEYVETVLDRYAKALEQGIRDLQQFDYKLVRIDGQTIDFQCRGALITFRGSPAIQIVGSDITERNRDKALLKKAEDKLDYMANYDELTDLPNRKHLERYLSYHISKAKTSHDQFAMMLLDLDRFKYINETLGHHIGDQLLIEVANRLKTSISKSNFIFRLSGDEFVVLIPDINEVTNVADIAKSVVTLFEEPFNLGGFETFITASIGVSIYPSGGEDIHELMKHADLAMYLAKEQGKNRYAIYTPQMNIKAYKTFILQNDLHKALNQNEFTLYFQPKVDTDTNRIIGAEVLLRWEHPSWGMISPGEFISLAEDNGLIVPIGEWIFRMTCSYVKAWQDKGLPPIKVSINVSVVQFLQKKFVSFLQEVINEYVIDPSWLELELTESILINNQKEFLSKMRDIKDLGISISIDDFGTGYSSLSYIRNFEIDTIKLDRSFIKDIAENSKCFAIAAMIVQLSRTLNIRAIAEGVETMEQLSFLQKMGCNYIQGYIFSRPVPVQDFEQLLNNRICLPIATTETKSKIIDRRKYFRIHIPIQLEADMTILSISEQKVNIGNTKVHIDNIGPGGLCFITSIDLPVKQDIILGFDIVLLDQLFQVYGRIVWTQELNDQEKQYGLEFSIGEEERHQLTLLLNKLRNHILKNIE